MAQASELNLDKLEQTCFFIMPFGEKSVNGEMVDFNQIYKEVFAPSVESIQTPEGSLLIPERTDMDEFSGSINQDMFEYLTYSRLAFADISGLNANVFYEVGVRHSMQESGTVLFRQVGEDIPFDIRTIKVFDYDLRVPDASRELIQRVVTKTLQNNRLDSPVRQALRHKWSGQQPSGSAGNVTVSTRQHAEAPNSATETYQATQAASVRVKNPAHVATSDNSRIVITVDVQ
ncbi:MAG: hypothetical protein ACI9DC_000788 [Gammaproteobacteria bacterium]|jgi:hypothetical protein